LCACARNASIEVVHYSRHRAQRKQQSTMREILIRKPTAVMKCTDNDCRAKSEGRQPIRRSPPSMGEGLMADQSPGAVFVED
jgi:hypothetical protein